MKNKALSIFLLFSLIMNIILITIFLYFYIDTSKFINLCNHNNKNILTTNKQINNLKQEILIEQKKLINMLKKHNKNEVMKTLKKIHILQYEIQKNVALNILNKTNKNKTNNTFFNELENNMCENNCCQTK